MSEVSELLSHAFLLATIAEYRLPVTLMVIVEYFGGAPSEAQFAPDQIAVNFSGPERGSA